MAKKGKTIVYLELGMSRYLSSPTGIISPAASSSILLSTRRNHLMCGICALRTRQSSRAVSPWLTVRLAWPNRISGCRACSSRTFGKSKDFLKTFFNKLQELFFKP
jgi:hypothetical protein